MTQNEIIYELLKATDDWVPMTILGNAAGCWAVHSRIADLRRAGHQIECRVEVDESRKKRSFYRLLGSVVAAA